MQTEIEQTGRELHLEHHEAKIRGTAFAYLNGAKCGQWRAISTPHMIRISAEVSVTGCGQSSNRQSATAQPRVGSTFNEYLPSRRALLCAIA